MTAAVRQTRELRTKVTCILNRWRRNCSITALTKMLMLSEGKLHHLLLSRAQSPYKSRSC